MNAQVVTTFMHAARLAAAPAVASLALLAASSAPAQRCEAPPGTAAVDQYCEVIPTDRGPTTAARFRDAAPSGQPTRPARRAEQLLLEQTFRGSGLATFIDRTRPEGAVLGASATSTVLPAGDGGFLAAIRASLGLGPMGETAFLVILLALTVVIAGLALADRRRRQTDA